MTDVDPFALPDTVEFTAWRGRRIDVWHLYDRLTRAGWKVDTEESNLMQGMSRVWRAEGVKVWLLLEKFVCCPPDGEVEALDQICFHRFDPAAMPTQTMYERLYEPGDELQPWFRGHREDWDWLVEHGDPQSDDGALLTKIAFREVPPEILLEAWAELEEAVVSAEA